MQSQPHFLSRVLSEDERVEATGSQGFYFVLF